MPSVFRSFVPVFALALGSLLPAQQGQGNQAPAGPLAPEKYKDIQVLKEVPASQIDATMQYFSAALGVTCASCHARDQATGELAFDKENRNKSSTREMIRLVQTVNGGDYGAKINCGTCHQGRRQPGGLQPAQMLTAEQIAALAARGGERGGPGGERGGAGGERGAPPGGERGGERGFPAGGERGEGGRGGQRGEGREGGQGRGGQPADPILEHYVAAIGGQAAVDKLTSKAWKGTVRNRANQTMPFAFAAAGDRFHSVVEDPRGTQAFGYDGGKAWMQAGKVVKDVEGFRVQQGLRLDDLRLVADFKKRCTNVVGGQGRLPAKEPGGQPVTASMVRGEAGPGVQERLFFDSTSGLLLRRQVITRTALNGALVETIDYSDYKDVSGVKVPHTVQYNNWDRLDLYTATEVKIGGAIDDAAFARPKG